MCVTSDDHIYRCRGKELTHAKTMRNAAPAAASAAAHPCLFVSFCCVCVLVCVLETVASFDADSEVLLEWEERKKNRDK